MAYRLVPLTRCPRLLPAADFYKPPPFSPTAAYQAAVNSSTPEMSEMSVASKVSEMSVGSGMPFQRGIDLTSFDLLDTGDGE